MMATTLTPSFTTSNLSPSERDRQARGKDPYMLGMDGPFVDSSNSAWEQGRRVRRHHETFEQKEKTAFATKVLANPDLLYWHAQARGDSVPSQRLRFVAMMCGFDDHHEGRPRGIHPPRQQLEPEDQDAWEPAAAGPSSASGAAAAAQASASASSSGATR